MSGRKDRRRSSAGWIRVVAIVTAVVVVLGLVAAVIGSANRTVELTLGETAEVDSGSIVVHGWERTSEGTAVSITVCRTGSGAIADLSAFVLVTPTEELEPSGSELRPLTDCLGGQLLFATDEEPDHVTYGSSPKFEWRAAAD